jgi:hypothetical protein
VQVQLRGITLEVGVNGLMHEDMRSVGFGSEAGFMRRRCMSLVILGVLAGTPTIGSTEDGAPSPAMTAMVAVPSAPLQSPWIRDEAAMILVGSALIGLAAAIRRAA